MEEILCNQCGEVWSVEIEFHDPDTYRCPFCCMPIRQLLYEVYRDEGAIEAIKQLLRRFGILNPER